MLVTEILRQINTGIVKILKKGLNNEEISSEEALKLLKVNGKEFIALQYVANQICSEKKEDIVTFIVNRNINFTNICYQRCKFCSFSLPAGHKDAFLLTMDEIRERVKEAKNSGCTEVCIQGGLNPSLKFENYIEILKSVKTIDPSIHIHAFSPQEVFYMSKLYGSSVENTLKEAKDEGEISNT